VSEFGGFVIAVVEGPEFGPWTTPSRNMYVELMMPGLGRQRQAGSIRIRMARWTSTAADRVDGLSTVNPT
jgi:hypothetical protein